MLTRSGKWIWKTMSVFQPLHSTLASDCPFNKKLHRYDREYKEVLSSWEGSARNTFLMGTFPGLDTKGLRCFLCLTSYYMIVKTIWKCLYILDGFTFPINDLTNSFNFHGLIVWRIYYFLINLQSLGKSTWNLHPYRNSHQTTNIVLLSAESWNSSYVLSLD